MQVRTSKQTNTLANSKITQSHPYTGVNFICTKFFCPSKKWISLAQDKESQPARTDVPTTMLRQQELRRWFNIPYLCSDCIAHTVICLIKQDCTCKLWTQYECQLKCRNLYKRLLKPDALCIVWPAGWLKWCVIGFAHCTLGPQLTIL